ncbi:MAG: DUF6174 domain-containing protein [Spirochaetaceae bacterium]|nr:DUF6174 domain-containing protein [Spirochaetaceae bacterium]
MNRYRRGKSPPRSSPLAGSYATPSAGPCPATPRLYPEAIAALRFLVTLHEAVHPQKNLTKIKYSVILQGRRIIMANFLKGLVFVVTVGFFSSCGGLVTTKVTVEFDYTKFNIERASWNSNPPPNYQYNLEHHSDGFSDPVDSLIFVKDGKYEKQEPKNDYAKSYFYLTITDIYSEINELYLEYNDTLQFKNDDYLKKIVIKYDEANHIPVEIEKYYHVSTIYEDGASHSSTKITQYKVN